MADYEKIESRINYNLSTMGRNLWSFMQLMYNCREKHGVSDAMELTLESEETIEEMDIPAFTKATSVWTKDKLQNLVSSIQLY